VDSIAAKYPQVSLIKLEVFFNSTNRATYQEFNARFNVQNPVVPSILIGDEPLIGEDPIHANLEPIILRMIEADSPDVPGDNGGNNGTNDTSGANSTSDANDTNVTGPPDDVGPQPERTDSTTDLTIAMVIVAAAADSINPCAISVMIILLIFLTSLGNKRRVLLVGLVYITTVYVVYFMAGLGIMAFLQSTTMTRSVYYVAAILSMVIGLVNIKDYFSFGKKPTLAIPESRKPMIKKYIERASIPAAMVLGIVVSLFELPCTGGIYFAILSLLGDSMTTAQGIPYLALYNAIYVLPLAVILAIFFMGVSADRANSWRLENRRMLRLVVGVVMLLLGAMMLLGML
jgi:cytochrome c biogenesis protein CcdA